MSPKIISKFSRKYNIPPYEQLIRYYQHANDLRQTIDLLDWEKPFSNLDFNKQVQLFNKIRTNTFEDFIPHKTVNFNKDSPGITKQIKNLRNCKKGKFLILFHQNNEFIIFNTFNTRNRIFKYPKCNNNFKTL